LPDGLGYEAVDEVYRRQAARGSRQPENVLVLAEYLGRQQRLPEALDVCEKAWRTCSPEAVAAVSVVLLHAAPAGDHHRRRVERWLETGINQNPEEPALRLCLANLRELQERYDEAERLYRQILERDGRNAVALNNLAWLLAFQDGKGAEALELIHRAIDSVGPAPALRDTRAVVQVALGRSEPAVQDLEEAIAAAATAPRWFHLAQAHRLAGNRDAAVTAFRQAEAAGLKAARLHPLERNAYQKLLADLREK
jgi:tetratricopeptide (TPR) repeat protein